MERPIKAIELLITIIGMVLGLGAVVYNSGVESGKNQIEISALKIETQSLHEEIRQVRNDQAASIKDIKNDVTEIKILLQDKQDRKK